MPSLSKYKLKKYQYGADIQKMNQIHNLSNSEIYRGQWLSKRTDSIIVREMPEQVAAHQAYYYLELNNHDHIIHTFGYIENNLNLTIFVQEYAQYGDLLDLLLNNQIKLFQTILIEMFKQISDAMIYMANKSFVHGDLCCQNILVFQVDINKPKNTLVKLTDFGLTCSNDHRSPDGNPGMIKFRYYPPEILRNDFHSEKSDVYSMGVLIWEALSNGGLPYAYIDLDDEAGEMTLKDKKLSRPFICDDQLWNLMNECWYYDPKERPNFKQIKNKLSIITISEIEESLSQITAIDYQYELDVDVKINGHFGKLYDAEWISKEERPIILRVMDEAPSEYELLVYKKFRSHPYILYTFGFVGNDLGLTLLLQERAPYDNFQSLLKNNQFQPSTQVLAAIFLQIIKAMIYVSKQGIEFLCHLDTYRKKDKWQSVKDVKFRTNQMIRPMLEAMRNLLRNWILYNMNSSIELHATHAESSSMICYTCSRQDLEKFGSFWILPDHLHHLPNTCPSNDQKSTEYRLKYEFLNNQAEESIDGLKGQLKYLSETCAQLSCFLMKISYISLGDLFLVGIDRMVNDEQFICETRTTIHPNRILIENLNELRKSYEEHLNRIKSSREELNLSEIYDLIEAVNGIPMVKIQLDAIRNYQQRLVENNQRIVNLNNTYSL